MSKKIPDNVLAVLSAGTCTAARFYLPPGQLDRKLYEAVNKVLTSLGGKWNTKAKAHIFADNCEPVIEAAIETGEFAPPAELGWFPTPAALAERLVVAADIMPGDRVLEPSAGEGALIVAIQRCTNEIAAVEVDPGRALACAGKTGVVPEVGDFLKFPPQAKFTRVVMNPPFAKRADIHHVMHALKFLLPGGKLVAIMSGGIEFREDKLTREFRAQCRSIERLPDESFKSSGRIFQVPGTSVRTVLVTMVAP